MAKIKKIQAREILTSQGIPTIEAFLRLETGAEVISSVPGGDGDGVSEKVELRDGDPAHFDGLGVSRAVSYINELIGPKLAGADVDRQADIDYWLNSADSTDNKTTLGVNSIMAVSTVVARGAAISRALPLYAYFSSLYESISRKKLSLDRTPPPIFTLVNGGAHGGDSIQFQEFQIVPSTSLAWVQALQMGVGVYMELQGVLESRNLGTSRGREGGFSPNLRANSDALEVLVETITKKKLHLGTDISLGIDLAASHFYKNSRYRVNDRSQPLKRDEYIDFLVELNKDYGLLLLEDPLDKGDEPGWKALNDRVGENTYLIGDDFISANINRLSKVVNEKMCSGAVVKFYQTATLTHMIEFIAACRASNVRTVVAHRLAETNDTLIADFAVGVQADFVKFGPPCGGEHVAKYNRLLAIDSALGRGVSDQ